MKLDIRRRGFTSGLKKYSIDALLLPRLFPVTRYLLSPYEQKFQFGTFEMSNVLRYSQFSVYTHLARNFRRSKNLRNIVARSVSFTLIKISANSRPNVGNSKRVFAGPTKYRGNCACDAVIKYAKWWPKESLNLRLYGLPGVTGTSNNL